LLTVLDVGPFSAYRCAYAHWQRAKEALQRSGELTIKTAEGHPRAGADRLASHGRHAADWRRVRLIAERALRPSGMTPPPPPSKFDGLLK